MKNELVSEIVFVLIFFVLYFSRDISGIITYYSNPEEYKITIATIYDFGYLKKQDRPLLHDESAKITYEFQGESKLGEVGRSFMDGINHNIKIAIHIKDGTVIRPSLQTGWFELIAYLLSLYGIYCVAKEKRTTKKIQFQEDARSALKSSGNYSEKLQNSLLENLIFFVGLVFLALSFGLELYTRLHEEMPQNIIYITFLLGIVLMFLGIKQIRSRDKIQAQEKIILAKMLKEKNKILFRLGQTVVLKIAFEYEDDETEYFFYKIIRVSLSEYIHLNNIASKENEITVYAQEGAYDNYFIPNEELSKALEINARGEVKVPLLLTIFVCGIAFIMGLLQYIYY
ncbi:MAG: hypothetical protein IJN92_04595 [Lachnospiraceae bacterium]|nr:hypothetical protein [Lachnospiraceae bacterium]